MTSHQWGLITFLVIRQTALVQMSFFKTPRFFAHGKSQDLTPAFTAFAHGKSQDLTPAFTALIQKGDWRGSESIRDLSTRTAGALAVPKWHFPTDTSVLRCEKIGRTIDRGQLNGDPNLSPTFVRPRFPLWLVMRHDAAKVRVPDQGCRTRWS